MFNSGSPEVGLRALLFDVDGTLADTERWGHRVAFNTAFTGAGLNWVWDEALYARLLEISGGKERIAYYLDEFAPSERSVADKNGLVAALHAAKSRAFKELLESGGIPLRPGVKRLLDEARQAGLYLGIVTTSSEENVSALLNHLPGEDIGSWFDVIAAGDMVRAKKPAPDIYQLAMRQLGLEARECIAIEDSRNGLRSALGAGIATVVITVNEYTLGEDFPGASLVVDHLGDGDSPCATIAGEMWDWRQVDVPLLRRIHRISASS